MDKTEQIKALQDMAAELRNQPVAVGKIVAQIRMLRGDPPPATSRPGPDQLKKVWDKMQVTRDPQELSKLKRELDTLFEQSGVNPR